MKFEEVYAINVNEHTEQKNNLTYLSWAWAWAEFKKIYEDAEYEILTFNNLPYVYDPNTGYMVFTTVTANGLTYKMWLPVMDGANKAMKAEPYTYSTKYGNKTVEQATMFDINKTIMRCLVKNLAMFGLGLYIYAGEDLPEGESVDTSNDLITDIEAKSIYGLMMRKGLNVTAELNKNYGIDNTNKLTKAQYCQIVKACAKLPDVKGV